MVIRTCIWTTLGLLLVLLIQAAGAEEIVVRVDRNPIAVDESVELLVDIRGDIEGEPDFSGLHEDFEILGQQSGSNIRIINGKTTRSRQYRLTLMPRRAGTLTVPALQIGKSRSRPVELIVTLSSQGRGNKSDHGDLFLEVTADPKTPYVQSQVLYTVRLFQGISLAGGSLSEPEAGGASFHKLGDDREYTTTRGNRSYRVYERRYVLFAEKPGKLNIQPIVFQGRLGSRSNSFFDPFERSGPTKRLRSKPIELDVLPIPEQAKRPWLPAEKVELNAELSLDQGTVRAGDPLTLSLRLTAHGLPARLLPELELAPQEGIKLYPDKARQEDLLGSRGIVGKVNKKIALVIGKPGTYTLPEITVPWWNTGTENMELAVIPARVITVLPAQSAAATPQAPLTEKNKIVLEEIEKNEQQLQSALASITIYRLLCLGMGCGWLITLLLWWSISRNKREKSTGTVREKVDNSYKQLSRELNQACRQNNAKSARFLVSQLLNLSSDQGNTSQSKLTSLAAAPLVEELHILDNHLYGKQPIKAKWTGAGLWHAWQDYSSRERSKSAKKTSSLKPLYADPEND